VVHAPQGPELPLKLGHGLGDPQAMQVHLPHLAVGVVGGPGDALGLLDRGARLLAQLVGAGLVLPEGLVVARVEGVLRGREQDVGALAELGARLVQLIRLLPAGGGGREGGGQQETAPVCL
jgi:hypothetical protein